MCAFFAVATHVHAYTISVQQDPQASGVYNVVLDTEGQSFNAIAGTVFFDDKLTVTPTILTGSSVVSLWTKQPTVSGNSVVFEGLLPGGFSEVYDQFGDHPRTKVTIFSMSFPYQEGVPTLHFSFDSPTVYANDGTGMAVAVTALPSTLSAPLVTSVTPVDTVPPEPFTIAVRSVPSFMHGRYFIEFSTHDTISGVAKYFVRTDGGTWKPVTSPYVVPRASQQYIVFVKAVDALGNERIEQAMIPAQQVIDTTTVWTLISLGIVGVIALTVLFLRKILYHR